MNAAIFLMDRISGGSKPEPVENFQFDIDVDGLKSVEKRLLDLQAGYCEKGDAKPKITLYEQNNIKTGKPVKVMAAESEADFYYAAYLGQKIKEHALPKGA